MVVTRFPDPRKTSEDGIVAFGGDLDPETLLLAYSQGIFPWPIEGLPLAWFCPPERAILEFKDLHIPRSLERARRKAPYRFTIDRAFNDVIRACASVPRPSPDGTHTGTHASTWITPEMIDAYCELHRLGHAHSVEAWEGAALVGGAYGVDAGGVFAGESMFHTKPNASKLALLHLVEHLHQRKCGWIDIQVLTPHMETLGAKTISRGSFLEKLSQARARRLKPFP